MRHGWLRPPSDVVPVRVSSAAAVLHTHLSLQQGVRSVSRTTTPKSIWFGINTYKKRV
jgi:hypothetical protein